MSVFSLKINPHNYLLAVFVIGCATLACNLSTFDFGKGQSNESEEAWNKFDECSEKSNLLSILDEYRDCLRKLDIDELEAIREHDLCLADPNCLSSVQGYLEDKRTEAISNEDNPEDETSGDANGGAPYLNLVSVKISDGWCFPPIEINSNQMCGYTLDWVLEYNSQDGGALRCNFIDSEDPDLSTFVAQVVQPGSGSWEWSTQRVGNYPGLGDYEESLACEMIVPDLDGQTVLEVAEDYIAPLTYIRE